MSRATFDSVQPVLPTQDVSRSLEFYVKRLGFTMAFRDSETEPKYAGVRRGNVELHLQWHDPAEWSAVERPLLRIVVPHVESLFAEYAQSDVFHKRTALRDTEWGTTEFAFYDPDKNGLVFYRDRSSPMT